MTGPTNPDLTPAPAPATERHDRPAPAVLGLWASAFVLVALIIVQLGRFGPPAETAAQGAMVSNIGDFSVLTFRAGGSEEMLAILDGRSEELVYYGVRNQSRLELLGRERLPDLFAAARTRFGR